jgi:hypothetical protein
MDLKQIREMVAVDMPIDQANLDAASLEIPLLHNKYLNILHDEKLLLHKFNIELKKLLKLKWEYYNGKTDEETLREKGWEPFQLKILKQDAEMYMEADEEVISLNSKVIFQKEKVDYLESIVKGLNNRQYHIRDAIIWRKFVNGVG